MKNNFLSFLKTLPYLWMERKFQGHREHLEVLV